MSGRGAKSRAAQKKPHGKKSGKGPQTHQACQTQGVSNNSQTSQVSAKAKTPKAKRRCDNVVHNMIDYMVFNTLAGSPISFADCSDPYCIRCLVANRQLGAGKAKLKKLFHDENLLTANTKSMQAGQLRLTSQIRVAVENSPIFHHMDFLDQGKFLMWLFKCGLIPAYERMLQESLRKRPADSPLHESYYSVTFYIMMVFLWVLMPKTDQEEEEDDNDPLFYTIMELVGELEKRKSYAACLVRSGKLIKLCLGIMRESRTTVDVINAVLLLEKLSSLNKDACDQIIRENGLKILVDLGTPAKFQKRVAIERDAGFPYYVKEMICFKDQKFVDYRDTPERRAEVESYTDSMVYKEIMDQNQLVITSCFSTLCSICMQNPATRHKVFHTPQCVTVSLRWHRHPLLMPNEHHDIVTEVSSLLCQLLTDKELASILVEQKQLESILDRIMFTTLPGPQVKYLQLLQTVLKHGGKAKQNIYENRHVMLALGCFIHSRIKALQDIALEILVNLVQDRPSVLHLLNSLGVVNELILMPYRIPDTWDPPVPTLMDTLTKLAKKTLKSKWKYPNIGNFVPCQRGEFEIAKLRKRGNDSFREGCYEEAITCYTSALILGRLDQDICSVLFSNRAECHLRKKRYQEVVRDTTIALSQGFDKLTIYTKTLFRRAKAFHALNRPFEALGDISACLWKQPDETAFVELHKEILEAYKKLDGALYKVRTCDNCGLVCEGLRKCANCETTHFCCKTCQKESWSEHRLTCGNPQPAEDQGEDNRCS